MTIEDYERVAFELRALLRIEVYAEQVYKVLALGESTGDEQLDDLIESYA